MKTSQLHTQRETERQREVCVVCVFCFVFSCFVLWLFLFGFFVVVFGAALTNSPNPGTMLIQLPDPLDVVKDRGATAGPLQLMTSSKATRQVQWHYSLVVIPPSRSIFSLLDIFPLGELQVPRM